MGYPKLTPIVATGSSEPRYIGDRFADEVNLKDFGGKTAAADNSTAIQSAATKGEVYVPEGTFKTSAIPSRARFRGPGKIQTPATVFCAGGCSLFGESTVGSPFFGQGDSQIFTNAERTAQGFAYVNNGTTERLYISVVTASTSTPQESRIVEFDFSGGILNTTHVAYSNVLNIGHAQGFGATVESGDTYLWSMSQTQGYITKTKWRGSSTSNDDVAQIQLLSGGSFDGYTSLTPTISADGRTLLVLCASPKGAFYTVFGWDLGNIEVNKPKIRFDVFRSSPKIESCGGICADANDIYVLEGSTYSRKTLVSKYTYAGEKRGSFDLFQTQSASSGNIISVIEAEGIAIYQDKLLVVAKKWEQPIVDVVTFDGNKYACITSNTGQSLLDEKYWQKTNASATKGAWDSATAYTAGDVSSNTKVIVSVHSGGVQLKSYDNRNSRYYDASGNTYVPMTRGSGFSIEALGENGSKHAFYITTGGNINLYDLRVDASSLAAGWISNISNATTQRTVLHGGDAATTAQTGFVAVYGNADTSSTSDALALGVGSTEKLFIDKNNNLTVMSSNSSGLSNKGFAISRGNAKTIDRHAYFYHTSTTFHVQGQDTLALETVDSNGDMATGVTLYKSSTLNCFYPTTTDVTTLGKSGNVWSNVYATTGPWAGSDRRIKDDIKNPSEELLSAWGDVEYKVFKFTDAVAKKGESARIHVGVVAQEVDETFKKHGLDASRYGLYGYDEWGDEYEEDEIVDIPAQYDEDGNETSPAVTHTEKKKITSAGNSYSIRYSEALALECAYLRSCISKMQSQIDVLVERINGLTNNGSINKEEK